MNLDAALATFVAESDELLTRMEDALLQAEQRDTSPEMLDEIFRAAHTIKGSAGVFGHDATVAFTHEVESLLDLVRAGAQPLSPHAALLLECCDHLRMLVPAAVADTPLDEPARARGDALVARLQALLGARAAPTEAARPAAPAAASVAADETGSPYWHLSLQFGQDVVRNGMDPLSFLRYLARIGEIRHVEALFDALPATAELDPEACHLRVELAFDTTVGQDEIEAAFDFVRDDCRLAVLPPHSPRQAYLALAEDADGAPLASILDALARCGSLGADDLGHAPQPGAEHEARVSAPTTAGEAAPPARAPGQESVAADGASSAQRASDREARLIRIDADRLDQLINMVGELVIAAAGTQLIASTAALPAVAESMNNVLRLVQDVRDTALGLRMVPIGSTLQRFHRVVRDVGNALGKDIELVISGGDTELDKSVIERIGDPLIHLIRNAADHGIESAEARALAGKPARARIALNAFHDSGCIVIQVVDDGAGLDRERILARARERGLVAEHATPTDREIFNLVFAPGFSTAERVSDLSGRGVGMDVVRRNIEALRGTVELSSESGRGTTVTIRLPLTLAIIDGFLVGVGAGRYVIPVDLVVECVELRAPEAAIALTRGYIDLRGYVLPCHWLAHLFGAREIVTTRQNVVVVQLAGQRLGIVVDTLLGEAQTVIKPLGPLFKALRGISGSTILGDGQVALILDMSALVAAAETPRSEPAVVGAGIR